MKTYVIRAQLAQDQRLVVDETTGKGVWDIHVVLCADAESEKGAHELAHQWLEKRYEIYSCVELTNELTVARILQGDLA